MAQLSPFMTAEPPLINPPPRKRRLGCLAKLSLGVLVVALLCMAWGFHLEHEETRALVERATAALLANDPGTAMTALRDAHERQPDDAGIAQLYADAQQKWLESVDQQIADLTPAQRYSRLGEYPVHQLSQGLAEPLATSFQQFVDRNTEDARVQINETIERAMDLVEAGKFNEGRKEMETLRVCSAFPELQELWANFDRFYFAQHLIRAGDLGQNGQIAAARELLEWSRKYGKPTTQALDEARFRIDLGDYSLQLTQAVSSATKGDQKTAAAKIEEAKPLLSHLLANAELQNFYPDLPVKDRGSPLINQLNAAQSAIRRIAAGTAK